MATDLSFVCVYCKHISCAQITAIGELVTLPLVVLVSFIAQPRLLFAMAKDGLLPPLFAEVRFNKLAKERAVDLALFASDELELRLQVHVTIM